MTVNKGKVMEEQRPYIERDEDEVNLLDYWRVIWKHKSLISALVIASVLTALVISLIMPKIYESTAAILAPKEATAGSGLASILATSGAGQFFGGMVPSISSTRDIFVSILKSRTMAQDIVDNFNLKEYYRAEYTDQAINALKSDTNISVSKEGTISVKVEARDPKLAADIANFYITNLDRIFSRLSITEAGRNRAFILERLAMTEKALRKAEEDLRRFQERNKAIVLQDQSRSAIEAAARVKGEIMAAEVQLEVMRNFATESNPQVIQLKRQIAEMKKQYAQMQYGKGWDLPSEAANPGEPRKEFYVPFEKVPEVGLELARLVREVKTQEAVFTILTQQLEQAKIQEARDVPMVQVLDRAVPAERKSKPKIKFNMALAGAVSLFMGIFLAFFLEYIQGLRQRAPLNRQ